MLANISISVLSLDIWSGAVDVNNTEYVNVYQISHPLNFFLPYDLCLGLTLVFVAIGLGALEKNGVGVTDGGFLQVLMTTTGDTAMTDVAAKGCLGGADNAPKELLEIKVRFGELVSSSDKLGVHRAGFGMIDETIFLRRRIAYS
jgi:hypothetical protein